MTAAAQPIKTLTAARAEIARLRSLYESNPLQVSSGHKHGGQYFDKALGDPAVLITDAMRTLRGVDFDTFVGTGLSGTLVAPLLARAMGRHFLIVRKERDGSHSSSQVEGTIGDRWIFVDDFICSGSTFKRCKNAVAALPTTTVLVGSYTYNSSDFTEEPQ